MTTTKETHKTRTLALTGLLAFGSGLAGFHHYGERLAREARGGDPIRVLVAARDLEVGSALSATDLTTVPIPDGYLDDRRLLESDRTKLEGGRLTTSLRAGQGLVTSDIDAASGPGRLSLTLPPGRRAYSLAAAEGPMAELLRAGDRVDVLVREAAGVRLLLENVRVLAIGRRVGAQAELPSTGSSGREGVTLDVSRKQAERLLEAEGLGTLRLALRNPDDETVSVEPEISKSEPTPQPSVQHREIEHVR